MPELLPSMRPARLPAVLRRYGAAAALLVAFAAPQGARAQSASAKAEVLATIRTLFDGMRQTDSTKARSVLHPKTLLVSAIERPNGGGPLLQVDAIDGWIKQIGTTHAEVYDERLRNPIVEVDGNLASVWVEYSLYIGPKLNHCGIDAFQLAKDATGWKIIAIADTRRRTGCTEIPAEP